MIPLDAMKVMEGFTLNRFLTATVLTFAIIHMHFFKSDCIILKIRKVQFVKNSNIFCVVYLVHSKKVN